MTRDPNMFAKPLLLNEAMEKANAWLGPQGYEARVICVSRDYKEQDALYAQGRESLADVNAKRKSAGLPPISDAENQRKVTWTRQSLHIVNLDDNLSTNDKSLAFDFGLFKNGAYLTGDSGSDMNLYIAVAKIMETVPGLYSGRHFNNPDVPHVQLNPIP